MPTFPTPNGSASDAAAVEVIRDVLDELAVAGGELVITATPNDSSAWRVTVLTDLDRAGRPQYSGTGQGEDLLNALAAAQRELASDWEYPRSVPA